MLLGEGDGGQDGLSLEEQLRHISPKEYPTGSSLLIASLSFFFLTIEKRGGQEDEDEEVSRA